jgi:glycosyltransferase involved in cell wall biosynthesis
MESRLRALASDLDLGESLRFVEPLPDLALAYADADLFALSSLWEGLPYVVLEAMAHGLPVASTNVDGIPEAVEHGVSGLVVPPRDPAALADAILRLLGDPAMRARMGEAGQRIVRERFGLERMADELVAVYRDIAGRA